MWPKVHPCKSCRSPVTAIRIANLLAALRCPSQVCLWTIAFALPSTTSVQKSLGDLPFGLPVALPRSVSNAVRLLHVRSSADVEIWKGVHHCSIDVLRGKKKWKNTAIETLWQYSYWLSYFCWQFYAVYCRTLYISSYWFFVHCVTGFTPIAYVTHTHTHTHTLTHTLRWFHYFVTRHCLHSFHTFNLHISRCVPKMFKHL